MRRFFRCNMRQFLLLFAAVGVLVAVLAPGMRRDYAARQHAQANRRLLDAANAGDVAAVRQALAEGADLFAADSRLTTPLGFAIRDGNLPLIDMLLAAGADPDMHSLGELTPLEQAARTDNAEVVQRLIRAGSTRNREKAISACVVGGHVNALRVLHNGQPTAAMLRMAIDSNLPQNRKLDTVRRLLEWGAPPDKPTNAHIDVGTRPIDLALQKQDGALVDLLREFGVPYTAREAVVLGRTDDARNIIEQDPSLIQKRFHPYYAVESPDRFPTLLGLALRHNRRELARELIDAGAPLDGLEWYDENMLVQAIVGDDPDFIRELVSRGFSVNSSNPQDAPLYHATWRGKTAAVKTLIELGADVSQPGLLHKAAYHNHPQIVRLLLAVGADPAHVDDQGRTPLEAAEYRAHVAVIAEFERFEAQRREEN
jgi:ankyrin repeat protein